MGVGGGFGDQGGCQQRIEFFVKIKKRNSGGVSGRGSGGGVGAARFGVGG